MWKNVTETRRLKQLVCQLIDKISYKTLISSETKVVGSSLKGLLILVFAISLALVPSLISANGLSIQIWTDMPNYSVGESWNSVSWLRDAPCIGPAATGILTIEGPLTHTKVDLDGQQLMSGSYSPTIGQPWAPTEVGTWTVQLNLSNPQSNVDCSSSTNFIVIMPAVRE